MLLFIMPLMSDIDELIESMQSVSDEERFELMNQFKAEVIQLQEEERMKAMMKVISITDSSYAHEVLKEVKSENLEVHHAKESDVDDVNENIDQAIEASDIAGVQESNEINEVNDIDEIERDEVEDEYEYDND